MNTPLDYIVKRHDQLCNVSLLPTKNEVCNCGADLALVELAALRARIAELEKLVKLNIEDTGGGCAVCGMSPVIFHNGDNWLCWQCVQDAIEGQSASLQEVADAREAITAAAQFVGDPKTYDLLITWLAKYA